MWERKLPRPTSNGVKKAVSVASRSLGRPSRSCLMCTSGELNLVLDLGHQPHSDSFPTKEQLDDAEVRYPLRLVSCASCGLLQIDYLVNPSILYQQDYLYVSSTTATGRKHYRDMANDLCRRFVFPRGSLAVDIGSNVGVLLGAFKENGMKVLGVDPAPIVGAQAVTSGIETVVDFFSLRVATRIKKRFGSATVITGTNVFAHLHELDGAVNGMKKLLAKDGVIVIEAPHAQTMIENLEYDTIYHQHVSYLSARPMKAYFNRMGLELFDVEALPIHGGSLRYFFGFPDSHAVQSNVERVIKEEETCGLYDLKRLSQFARDVEKQRRALLALILDCKTK